MFTASHTHGRTFLIEAGKREGVAPEEDHQAGNEGGSRNGLRFAAQYGGHRPDEITGDAGLTSGIQRLDHTVTPAVAAAPIVNPAIQRPSPVCAAMMMNASASRGSVG